MDPWSLQDGWKSRGGCPHGRDREVPSLAKGINIPVLLRDGKLNLAKNGHGLARSLAETGHKNLQRKKQCGIDFNSLFSKQDKPT